MHILRIASLSMGMVLIGACKEPPPPKGKAWVENGAVKVAITSEPDTQVRVSGKMVDLQGKTDGTGKAILSGPYPPDLVFLSLRIVGAQGDTMIPVLMPRLSGCDRKETSPSTFLKLDLAGAKVSRCGLKKDGTAQLIFKRSAGMTISLGSARVECPKTGGHKATCIVPLSGLIAHMMDADLINRNYRLTGPKKQRPNFGAKKLEKSFSVPLTVESDGLKTIEKLQVTLQLYNSARFAIRAIEAGRSLSTDSSARGLLYFDNEVTFKTYYHNMKTLRDARYFATTTPKRRNTGRCGPYKDKRTKEVTFFEKWAKDVLVRVKDSKGITRHERLFRSGSPGVCPAFMMSNWSVSSKASHAEIKRWLLEISSS